MHEHAFKMQAQAIQTKAKYKQIKVKWKHMQANAFKMQAKCKQIQVKCKHIQENPSKSSQMLIMHA